MKLYGNSGKKSNNDINTTQSKRNSSKEIKRTPEEQKKIDSMIEKYQRKKKIKRLSILGTAIITLVVAGYIFLNSYVKPPEYARNPTPPPSSATVPPNHSFSTPNTSLRTVDNSNRKEGVYTFVVVGNDDGSGNTDTMLVGMLDTVNNKLNIVSIPRDTLVNVPWSVKKANTIMSFSDNSIEGLRSGIRDLTGFVPDSYIIVDLDAFMALVDTLGGVYFDVPQDMYYEDPWQDTPLYIHLSEGYQLLDGYQAMGLVRYRNYVQGDIQRINTQQAFMKALAKQLLDIGNITKITEFANIFSEYVDTDMTVGNIIWYGMQLLKLEEDDINFYTVPEFYEEWILDLSYCSIYLDDWLVMINEHLNPYNEEITHSHVNILTRDSNGELYATTGEIAGGIYSFYDNRDYDDYDYSYDDDDYDDDYDYDSSYDDSNSEDYSYDEDDDNEDYSYSDDSDLNYDSGSNSDNSDSGSDNPDEYDSEPDYESDVDISSDEETAQINDDTPPSPEEPEVAETQPQDEFYEDSPDDEPTESDE